MSETVDVYICRDMGLFDMLRPCNVLKSVHLSLSVAEGYYFYLNTEKDLHSVIIFIVQ